ncbi:MAG: tRNA pseudouridine(55) synthase TruB [Peptococcaceae bacterium]|nr:tRNA pseudouridine(55) synthase TruB [Peptococcaceae bacterium]
MDGIINVLKPVGMTSADVVRWIQKVTKVKKVGHIGTLDPGAAGVLPVCLGKATRLVEYYTGQQKCYRAELTFGITTDTLDSYGVELSRKIPNVNKDDLQKILPRFIGRIEQVPPMYSAVRKNGKHLYEYARQGLNIERETRQVVIDKLELLEWQEGDFPKAMLDITCSKGTYIRSLCYDIGQALECGAHMSFLLRLKSGNFDLDSAFTLEEIVNLLAENDTSFLLSPEWGLELPQISIPSSRLQAFKNGLPTNISMVYGEVFSQNDKKSRGNIFQVYCHGKFIGIGTIRADSLYPEKVLFNG